MWKEGGDLLTGGPNLGSSSLIGTNLLSSKISCGTPESWNLRITHSIQDVPLPMQLRAIISEWKNRQCNAMPWHDILIWNLDNTFLRSHNSSHPWWFGSTLLLPTAGPAQHVTKGGKSGLPIIPNSWPNTWFSDSRRRSRNHWDRNGDRRARWHREERRQPTKKP
jgi:hypothetical protein